MKKITQANSLILATLLVSGCGYNIQSSPTTWVNSYEVEVSDTEEGKRYSLCKSFGCDRRSSIQFYTDELDQVRQHFSPPAVTAEEERLRIATGIGLFERITGPKLRTFGDQAANNTSFISRSNQLDCVAESLNTTRYLLILQQMNLLHFHRPGGNVHRGPFTLNAPHNSATIVQLDTQQAFAVDSWFGANAEPAWITPVDNWLTGADPDE
ncbi:hypothetical protein ACMXYX_00180 [Neptuniibacter sp. QD72_48]|uniref:hypothetical protein n=1 Tax=unclassified Neptuniibacter TaxID=2630693 RepID=UPI0039F6B17A